MYLPTGQCSQFFPPEVQCVSVVVHEPLSTYPQAPQPGVLRVLCLGDVFAKPGREAVKRVVQSLSDTVGIHIVIANGENSAGGIGLTPATVKELHAGGVHIITTGNHVWRHKECYATLKDDPTLLRPANFGPSAPGKALCLYSLPTPLQKHLFGVEKTLPQGEKSPLQGQAILAVGNFAGRVFMTPVDCPFKAAAAMLENLPDGLRMIIIDFHAEATSEKLAFARFLDGKVSAIFGTHTHVQTADATIAPSGTASISDVGMCGVEAGSVLGMDAAPSVARFVSGMPHPFRPAKGPGSINGIIFDIDAATGKTLFAVTIRSSNFDSRVE